MIIAITYAHLIEQLSRYWFLVLEAWHTVYRTRHDYDPGERSSERAPGKTWRDRSPTNTIYRRCVDQSKTIIWVLERCTDSDDQDGACEVAADGADTYSVVWHRAIAHAILTSVSLGNYRVVVFERHRRRRERIRDRRRTKVETTGTVDPLRSSFYATSARQLACSIAHITLTRYVSYLLTYTIFVLTLPSPSLNSLPSSPTSSFSLGVGARFYDRLLIKLFMNTT